MAKKSSMQMMADAIAPTKSKVDKTTGKPVSNANDTSVAIAEVAAGNLVAAAEVAAKADDVAVAAGKPAKAPKEPKGPVKIETCGQLLKALWSSRGLVFISVPSFHIPLAIVKNVMTTELQNGDLSAPAPYDLVARADNTGSDLIPR